MPGDISVPNAAYTPAEMLAFWMNAEAEIAAFGQTNGLRNNVLTRADMGGVRESVAYWQSRVNSAAGTRTAFNRVRLRRRP
jgi:hypothetical protein